MPGWAFGLMAAGSAALGIALFLVVSTIALLLLPVVLVAGGVGAFLLRRKIERMLKGAGLAPEQGLRAAPRRRAAPRKAPRDEIEDADYRVVEDPAGKAR